MSEIIVHVPPVSEGYVSESLCELTRVLQGITGEGPHGVLGGAFGYGCDYDNAVFTMRLTISRWFEGVSAPHEVGRLPVIEAMRRVVGDTK